eukprot:748996-Hanusia_phi.AAC.3
MSSPRLVRRARTPVMANQDLARSTKVSCRAFSVLSCSLADSKPSQGAPIQKVDRSSAVSRPAATNSAQHRLVVIPGRCHRRLCTNIFLSIALIPPSGRWFPRRGSTHSLSRSLRQRLQPDSLVTSSRAKELSPALV